MTRYRHLITDENRKWWTLGAMCFALFMIMLDNTVVNVALPSIQQDLGASISGLEWTINGYTLSFAVLLATGGRLGDIFGRRRMFLAGVVIFALSSATAGFAARRRPRWSLSRVVQGVGAALMMPATLSIITDAFPAHERGKAMGTWAGVSALALAIGPVLGGFLTEHVSWRAIFYLNIPVAIGAVIATLFAVRESRDTSVGREVDYAGVAVLTAGLTALVLALVEGNSWGWGSTEIVAPAGRRRARAAAFVASSSRVKAPMVQFDLLSDRNFLGAVVVALIITFAMLGVFFFLALYMQDILGYSPLEAGVRFLPSTLMIVGVAPVAGRLSDRFGPRWLIAGGLAMVAASLFSFSRHRGRLHLPRPAARVHAARHRHRDDDVADDQRRDERGAGAESRHRLRRPLDVPDGRRQPRRRRHRGDLPGPGQLAARHPAGRQQGVDALAARCDLRPARRRRRAARAGPGPGAGEGSRLGGQRSLRLRAQPRDDRRPGVVALAAREAIGGAGRSARRPKASTSARSCCRRRRARPPRRRVRRSISTRSPSRPS